MPILVLLLISLSAGTLVFWAGRRYPTPVGTPPTDMAEKASVHIEAEMERHPWLLRLVQGRLDPATATGLALTLALGLAIVGGLLVGAFAYLVRSSETLVDADRSVGQWGVDHATAWSTDALQLVTELGSSLFIVPATLLLAVVEYRRVPNRWMPVFLLAVVAGEIILVNTIKAILDRVRPDFYEITETLGPSFPSGHSGLAAAFYAAAALVLARKRSPRTRALLAAAACRDRGGRRVQPRPPRRPLDVGRHRRSGLRLGLVRHLRDRLRWTLPGARRAGRGRRRGRGGARRRARRTGSGRSDVVEPALQRAEQAPPAP